MNRKLESVQERVGRRLLGGSRTMAGVAVIGGEERREEIAIREKT